MMRYRIDALAAALAILTLAAGCSRKEASTPSTEAPADTAASAVAVAELSPTQGSSVRGTVTFTQQTDGVRIVAHVTGLSPGDHGFHVHESGDCSAPDGMSAGEHFNPTSMSHGSPEAESRHVGDLGNITADAQGNAEYQRVDARLQLDGGNSIVGRAVIVHASPDDMTSQPSGNAGARLACGVVNLR